MYSFKTKVRVRYAETDKMGFCYYGNYATYFEIARVEALRNLGVSYKVLEDEGTFLPVSEFNVKYLKPAYYDDELTIHVFIKEMPGVKIKFTYETYNDKDENSTYSSGSLNPLISAEWFYTYPDTIQIRSNWELDLNPIDLKID